MPHETIVDEILDGLRGRARRAEGRCAAEARGIMTAPLRSGDPITVNVALGDRAYDIVIGRGLLATLGERIASAPAGLQGRDRHRRDRGAPSSRGGRSGACRRRHRLPRRRWCRPARAARASACFERVCDATARRPDRAQRCGGGARRRRGRRSRRFRRRRPAPRHRFRAGADDAAGAGRFLGRRQDRDQRPPRQEPRRRVPSADPGGRRHRAARHAAGARVPRRLRRGREIRTARRRELLRLARRQLARRVRRAGRAREHAIAVALPRQGRDRRARRARDRRPHAAQPRPHLRPRLRGRGRLLRQAAAWRGGRRSACRCAFEFSARRGLHRQSRRRPRHRASCGGRACRPMSKPCPAAIGPTSTR